MPSIPAGATAALTRRGSDNGSDYSATGTGQTCAAKGSSADNIPESEGGWQHDQRKQPAAIITIPSAPSKPAYEEDVLSGIRQRRCVPSLPPSGGASITGRFLLRYGPARFADKKVARLRESWHLRAERAN